MIYDIVITTTFKNGETYVEEDSVEAPSIVAAIMFVSDGLYHDPYKPSRKDDDEGEVTIDAKRAAHNIPAYQFQKAAVLVEETHHMITGWEPVY